MSASSIIPLFHHIFCRLLLNQVFSQLPIADGSNGVVRLQDCGRRLDPVWLTSRDQPVPVDSVVRARGQNSRNTEAVEEGEKGKGGVPANRANRRE